jgi:branched-chain amino acid transport system substrate-binding protein
MDKYYPDGDKTDGLNVGGYNFAQTLVQVLKQCGDDLTRENVMKQAANLKNFTVPMLLPGITINTSPTDYAPIKQMQMAKALLPGSIPTSAQARRACAQPV